MSTLAGPESPVHEAIVQSYEKQPWFDKRRKKKYGFLGWKKTCYEEYSSARVNEKIAIGLLVVVSVSRSWCIVFGLPW